MASLFNRYARKPAGSESVADSQPTNVEVDGPVSAEKPAQRDAFGTKSKTDPEVGIHSSDSDDATREEDLDPDVAELPLQVRKTVSLEDDPNMPVITFRYFLLSIVLIAPGAFLYQMGQFRTTSSPYSVLFVQVMTHYLGKWLAAVLPAWEIRVPFTRWIFSLNPGPWSVKEHVMVTISASSGATSNAAWTPIALAELYYNDPIHPAACIFFMFAIVFLGYSLAAMARQFILYDPDFLWPQALMQTSLFETLRKSADNSRTARKQKRVFFIILVGVTLWQFLPEYVFPFVSSLSFLCWVAPHNAVANFVGAGIGGMGVLNLSLDWSTISENLGNPMIMPFWTSAVLFAAYVFNSWILIPAAKWGSLGTFKYGLMSNDLFLANGTEYPVTALMTPDLRLNETALKEYGPAYMGTQLAWGLFFDYASYISAFTWIALFGHGKIRATAHKIYKRFTTNGGESISRQYTDRLNVLMRAYPEVPVWWYVVLFVASFLTILIILAKGLFFIPIWTYIIALLTGAACIIPMGYLYALSNFQVAIGSFNELMYGYMINAVAGHKHPAGASTYGSIAGDVWYRAQYMLQDQKIGHYMHLPPRAVFFSQLFGELIGIPINYGIIRWVIRSKRDYLLGLVADPLGQWTGQQLVSYNTMAVQYVLLGPQRLFAGPYHPILYGFLFGAAAPCVIYALHRAFPRSRLHFHLWNVTIFAAGMSQFYGNLSTGYTSRFLVAWVCMYYFYRRRFDVWRRYNFLVAAAADAAFNINMLLIFVAFSSGKVVTMPVWWGNRSDVSVERCFALDSA